MNDVIDIKLGEVVVISNSHCYVTASGELVPVTAFSVTKGEIVEYSSKRYISNGNALELIPDDTRCILGVFSFVTEQDLNKVYFIKGYYGMLTKAEMLVMHQLSGNSVLMNKDKTYWDNFKVQDVEKLIGIKTFISLLKGVMWIGDCDD